MKSVKYNSISMINLNALFCIGNSISTLNLLLHNSFIDNLICLVSVNTIFSIDSIFGNNVFF